MDDFYEKIDNGSATENPSAAFSGWVQKLRFDKSFTAKLILSDERVKEYYAEIASEILGYEKIRSRTSWSGVCFSAGRERFASVAMAGKTLCLYLAVDPETLSSGKYKAKNVESVKKRAKTPALLRIKSDGAKRHALKLIAAAAENFGLKQKKDAPAPIQSSLFRTDSFNNLVTRGLIRILRYGHNEKAADGSAAESPATAQTADNGAKENVSSPFGAYEDTVFTTDGLFSRHGVYGEITAAFAEGVCKASFSQKLMLRAVDEIWVRAIEDCVHSLDELIRNPNHFIAETEEVLPIELTKKVSGRSVAHLCRHTDYLSPDDKGEITPTKMLNVFRDDSILTYENKFLNTLVNRLYVFVGKRYAVMKDRGSDERTEKLEFENSFAVGEGKARVCVSVEYSERDDGSDSKKVLAGSGLWARVEKLYSIVTGYVNSSFAKQMDKNFIRPPVMRTNAIIKNKYFRECLALWEFIESYEDSGYGITVSEKQREISPEFAKELYKNAAMLYFAFRHDLDNGYGEQGTREYNVVPDLKLPDDVVPEAYREQFIDESLPEGEADDIALSLAVALAADKLTGEKTPAYRKSFAEKLCEATDDVKFAFAEVCNKSFAYKGVKIRYSAACATLRRGRVPLIRITTTGKSLKVFFALSAGELPEKFRVKDASGIKKYSDTPAFIRVKSRRSLSYALQIMLVLAEKHGLVLSNKQVASITPEQLDYEYFGLFKVVKDDKKQAPDGEKTTEDEKTTEGATYASAPQDAAPTYDYNAETVSFGTEKSETAEKAAEYAEKLAVKETELTFEGEKPPVFEEDDEAKKEADRLEGFKRVESNYSKPTDYGIDDSSGFISDEKQAEHNERRRNKGIFGKRRRIK